MTYSLLFLKLLLLGSFILSSKDQVDAINILIWIFSTLFIFWTFCVLLVIFWIIIDQIQAYFIKNYHIYFYYLNLNSSSSFQENLHQVLQYVVNLFIIFHFVIKKTCWIVPGAIILNLPLIFYDQ